MSSTICLAIGVLDRHTFPPHSPNARPPTISSTLHVPSTALTTAWWSFGCLAQLWYHRTLRTCNSSATCNRAQERKTFFACFCPVPLHVWRAVPPDKLLNIPSSTRSRWAQTSAPLPSRIVRTASILCVFCFEKTVSFYADIIRASHSCTECVSCVHSPCSLSTVFVCIGTLQ